MSLNVLDVSNGEIICSIITNLTKKVGRPLQIIGDYGPDIKKGIELYTKKNTRVIYTYDFTHQVARWRPIFLFLIRNPSLAIA